MQIEFRNQYLILQLSFLRISTIFPCIFLKLKFLCATQKNRKIVIALDYNDAAHFLVLFQQDNCFLEIGFFFKDCYLGDPSEKYLCLYVYWLFGEDLIRK